MTKMADAYLDLLKRSLLNLPYIENEVRLAYLCDCLEKAEKDLGKVLYNRETLHAIEDNQIGANTIRWATGLAEDGRKNRPFAHLMMGRKRLENIEALFEKILADDVPGDFVEAGTWKGGGPIFVAGLMKAKGLTDRNIWVADSFQGVPPATAKEDEGLKLTASDIPYIAVSQQRVSGLFERYGLLGDHIRFLSGWFKDSLPSSPIEKIAILRLDGDLYESTTDALVALYDRVVSGGFIIIDDYGAIPACQLAVDRFRSQCGISAKIEIVDWTGVFWRKP
jgi:O-methyltransferase